MRSVATITLAAVLLLNLAGCERWALDRQMEELCKKDGGVKVYETVTLPATYFEHSGRLKVSQSMAYGVSSEREETQFQRVGDDEYRIITKRQILAGATANPERGEGRLVRLHWAIYRWPDRKLLGEQVEYRRVGGDSFTFGFHPSSASCPRVDRDVQQIAFTHGE